MSQNNAPNSAANGRPPIFDGHNDLLARLARDPTPDPARTFVEGGLAGHLDLPRMAAGGFAGGLFALFAPPPRRGEAGGDVENDRPSPGFPPMRPAEALPIIIEQTALLYRLEEAAGGRLKICRTTDEIGNALSGGAVASVLHLEGAEAIDAGFASLRVLYEAGLRSLGPVWSRETIFGTGVPFRHGSTPDIGPGLTAEGRDLVRACNQLRIAVDLSHMNEKSFRDVANISDAPLIASHSNAHAICPHARNLTDDQLREIGNSGGIVGLNLSVWFLRPDGRGDRNTSLDVVIAHIDHMIATAGIDHIGFGSDFDGGPVPAAIGDASGLDVLRCALREHGLSSEAIEKICFRNWLRVLERSWQS